MHSTDNKAAFKKAFQKGELYGKWSDIYTGNDFLSSWAKHRLDVVLRLLKSYGLGKRGKALDLGVGSGRLLRELDLRGCEAYGADFSFTMLNDFRDQLDGPDRRIGYRLLLADVEAVPVKSASFELITCLGVLEYLKIDSQAISEMRRILRPGGYLILVVASYHRIGGLLRSLKKKILRGTDEKPPFAPRGGSIADQVRMIKPLDLRKAAIEAGFTVERFFCFGGKIFGRYFPIRIFVPGLVYIGDHCLLLLRRPE